MVETVSAALECGFINTPREDRETLTEAVSRIVVFLVQLCGLES